MYVVANNIIIFGNLFTLQLINEVQCNLVYSHAHSLLHS